MTRRGGRVLVLSGPTATGKTALAVRLAREARRRAGAVCEVVNFDSMLFYRELSVGTAKPSEAERREVPHHLVDVASFRSPMDAFRFSALAARAVDGLLAAGRVPVLVGGSGFYLRALLKGMIDGEPAGPAPAGPPPGIDEAREGLGRLDPDSLASIHPNDHYRLVRAWEYRLRTGARFSEAKRRMERARPWDFSSHRRPGWDVLHLHVDVPRDEHLPLIRARTRRMLADGLVGEVRGLLASCGPGRPRALRAVGYRDAVLWLDGGGGDEGALADRIDASTRRLAKSQRTFFKKVSPKRTFHGVREGAALVEAALGAL